MSYNQYDIAIVALNGKINTMGEEIKKLDRIIKSDNNEILSKTNDGEIEKLTKYLEEANNKINRYDRLLRDLSIIIDSFQ